MQLDINTGYSCIKNTCLLTEDVGMNRVDFPITPINTIVLIGD